MTSNDRNNGTHRSTGRILGVGALACVVCCIGPILGLLGAIGIATIAGVLAFGIAGLTIALLAIPVVHRRRSARARPDPTTSSRCRCQPFANRADHDR